MRPESKDVAAAAAKSAAELSKKKRKMAAFNFVTSKVKEAANPAESNDNSETSPENILVKKPDDHLGDEREVGSLLGDDGLPTQETKDNTESKREEDGRENPGVIGAFT